MYRIQIESYPDTYIVSNIITSLLLAKGRLDNNTASGTMKLWAPSLLQVLCIHTLAVDQRT